MRLIDLQWRAFAQLLARSRKPILCGPFRSEVGFELFYWIPFLSHLRETYGISRDRLFYIGRGGSAQWFDAAGRADLFEFQPVDAVRTITTRAAQQTGSVKQLRPTSWERTICALAAETTGLKDYHVLSPSWMYRLLEPFWAGQQTESWLNRRTKHPVRLQAPPLSPDLQKALPADYIAMRWYARATWPLREDLVLWTRRLVEATASRIPVVLITSGFQADDHADINLGAIPNVVKLHEIANLTPLNNLAVQSSVIAHAKGYVGTYGGMAQGAMRWGVPALSFYENFGQTSPQHLQLAHSLSLQSGVPFIATYPQAVEHLLPLIRAQQEGAVYG